MNGKLLSNQIELISSPSNFQVLSTKLLNKKTNKKLKSVTIIHSATTETVRLPEDNNGVIVHTAVRTKVPLKQKVRGERGGKNKKKSLDHKKTTSDKLGESSHATAGGGVGAAVRPKRKKTTGRSQEQRPQQQQQQKKLLSLYKSKSSSSNKKEIIDYSKKRMGGGGGASDKPAGTDLSAIGKVQKWLLDSPANAGNDGENSSIISGDVLQSNSTAAAMESIALKKSLSTPERLLSGGGGGGGLGGATAMKKQKQLVALNGNGSAQQEKVKLQVVYKPPFKFSLKLKKRNPVSTTVVSPYRAKKNVVAATGAAAAAGGKKNGMRSGSHHDKNRIGIMSSSSQDKSTILRKNRLALLIRSEKDSAAAAGDASTSRGDELLLPSGSGRDSSRYYENVDHKPVNSATFRIKKSSSSGNASQLERNAAMAGGSGSGERKRTGSSTMKSNNSKDSLGAADTTTTMASDRSRDISIKSGGGFRSPYASNNTERGSLKDQLGGGGSSGNLVMRSSTTNLAKMNGFQKNEKTRNSLNMQRQLSSPAGDSTFKRTSDSNSNVLLGRNATATNVHNNLQNGNMIMFKKLSTSNTNLAKFSDEFLARRASNTSLNNAGMPLPRRPSMNSTATPKRRASINSHRQQGSGTTTGTSGTTTSGGGPNGSFDRRASMGSHNARKSKGSGSRSGGGGGGSSSAAASRPHTAACDTDRSVPFEWPPPPMEVAKRLDDPLPSDMEVLCSDVEHSAYQDR